MAVGHQELGHVEANATGTDDGHALAHRLLVPEHVDVAQHLGVVLPRNLGVAWCHAGGHHHLVKAGQVLRLHGLVQV